MAKKRLSGFAKFSVGLVILVAILITIFITVAISSSAIFKSIDSQINSCRNDCEARDLPPSDILFCKEQCDLAEQNILNSTIIQVISNFDYS